MPCFIASALSGINGIVFWITEIVRRMAPQAPPQAAAAKPWRGLATLWLWVMLWASPAGATPLGDRLAAFPNWQQPPTVQAAHGDLYYPAWFTGTWEVTTTLVDLAAPLAPEVVTPGFESNQQFLQRPIRFQARFMPEVQNAPGWLPVPLHRQPLIVGDRAFNGKNLAQAYLDQPHQPSPVKAVKIDPANPNRQITLLQGDRQLLSTVTARTTETPDPQQFLTTEVAQQEFRRSGQIYFNQVETTTAYQHPPHPAPADPSIRADQVTAIYLSPQDPDFFKAGDRPVALYRYRLEFRPTNPTDSPP